MKGIWPEELPSVLWAYRTGALENPSRESSVLIGRDPIKSPHGREKTPTTWRR